MKLDNGRTVGTESLYERAKKYLLERLIRMRDYIDERTRHLIKDSTKKNQAEDALKTNKTQGAEVRQSDHSKDEIKVVTANLEKLITT